MTAPLDCEPPLPLSIDLLGTRVLIQCDAGVLRSRVRTLLAPFERHGASDDPPEVVFSVVGPDGPGRYRRLVRDSKTIAGGTGTRVLDRLVTEVNRLALERCPHLAVHAGVVAWGDRGIAFPAPSGAGKSTLTAACVRTGFGYVSDEALCLGRSRGSLIAYPKPLGLSRDGLACLGIGAPGDGGEAHTLLTAAELGGSIARDRLELSDVVLLERGGPRAELTPLPRSEAVAALLRFAFNHYDDPARSFRLAAQTALGCRTWRLRYADPMEAAGVLRAELSE